MPFPSPNRSAVPVRVVVTGAGIITALGNGVPANADGFRTGRKAFGPVGLFDVSRQRTRIAAEVVLPAAPPPNRLSARVARRLERAARMLLTAGHEAWTSAGWEAGAEDLPLVLGTTSGGMTLGEDFLRHAASALGSRRGQATRVVHYQAQRQAGDLADALGFRGPVTVIANACASGANAIGHAYEQIRSGRTIRALAGGYDALSHLVFAGFDSLQALSPTAARPFDAARDGLSLGEGAALVCLESLDHARRRGAVILGEILGYGAATDLHHLTQPRPDGATALAAMRAACAQAGISPERIGYVNAHGTGTPLNDAAEAAAINAWAGPAAAGLAVSSTKAGIGHLLGAAGAVEVVACLLALRGGWLPPQTGTGRVDPACGFRLVREPEEARFDHVLSNSFGFGGANASLVVGRSA